jgi:hypothetical protein
MADAARTLRRYAAACRDPVVWRRTLMLGLPVGLLQAALNQGDNWWRHAVDAAVVAKTILSPLLSCSIAFLSAVATQAAKNSHPTSS